MYYKEVMEPYLDANLINGNTILKDALAVMQENQLSILIICDEHCISGILTKDALLTAYGLEVSINKAVKDIWKPSYGLVNENEEITEDLLINVPFLIVVDEFRTIKGIVSQEIFSRQLLKWSMEKMKKEIQTKKILHQEDLVDGEKEPYDTNYFIDYYNRITKLIYINKELWDIIEFSSDSIYVTDGEGTTVYANDAFERMTGAAVSTVLGKTVFEAEEKGIYKPSISALVLKEKRQVTLIQRGINGKDLIVTGTPVFDIDGKIYMVICNSKDIDELSVLKNYLLNIKSSSVKSNSDSTTKQKIIYTSEYMSNLMKMVNKVVQLDTTILISGESGTGKGLIARYIHENSNRSDEKMIEINCSAIPESLFESELFGYESGAFTGAKKEGKPGIIEMANKGTLFLDEIGDMPMHMQVKLLKMLQDRQVTRVGALEPIKIDVRIIAATNKDLKQLIDKELFRADLYYRLNVFPIGIAPLRERSEDIYTLLQHFVLYYNKKHSNNLVLTQEAQDKIAGYGWPGNVRELEHFIERLVIIKEGIVGANDLDLEQDLTMEKIAVRVNKIVPLKEAVDETERQLIGLAMKITKNSYSVAELLEISQASAHRKIKKYS